MWQRNQSRTGVTWKAPWKIRLSSTITAQSGTPGGPVITTLTALGTPYAGQFGPSTLSLGGRTVSNPLAATYRFQYANRGIGQIWTPWLIQWNTLVRLEITLTDQPTVHADLNKYNL